MTVPVTIHNILSEEEPAVVAFPETADIETSSDDYATRFSGDVGAWFLKLQEQATLKLLKPYPGATILDVGGGHGQTTEALVNAGYRVTVLGSDESCMNRIRSFVDSGQVAFKVGNVIDLPYEARSFDVVLSYRLVPHVERWQELLTDFARVADKAVIVDYPELRSFNMITPLLFGMKKQMEGNTREYTLFRRQQLLDVFDAHGFAYSARVPEFFLPMVLHRKLKQVGVSQALEGISRTLGLTWLFGSPVIMKVTRKDG